MTTQSKEVAKKPESLSLIQKQITDDVLTKINSYREGGLIRLPKDYSVENALKAAGIILQETTDKDGKSVLETCSRESIAMALLKMVTEGLSPLKKHGSFIAFGKKLTWLREYDGDVTLAKRGGLKYIHSNVIYKKDAETFSFEVDVETGRKRILSHKSKLENIDLNEIVGAYAVIEMEDGTRDAVIMTKKQIEASWNMGAGKGNTKAHNGFTDEMCRKTVERRACKPILRRADDSALFDDDEYQDPAIRSSNQTIQEHANQEEIGFDEAEEIQEAEDGGAGEEQQAEPTQKSTEVKGGPEPEPVSEGGKGHVKGPGF